MSHCMFYWFYRASLWHDQSDLSRQAVLALNKLTFNQDINIAHTVKKYN